MYLLRSVVVLFLALSLPVRANLGDSVEQCVKRYGKPIGYSEAGAKSPFGTLVFTAANFTLIVFLLGDKEVGSRVSKTDKSAFTDPEVQNILNAESDSQSPWVSTPSTDPSSVQWTRNDKSAFLYDKDKHMVIVTSPAMDLAFKSPPPTPIQTPAPTNAAPVKHVYAN